LIFIIWLFILATAGVALQIGWNDIVFIEDHSVGDAQFLASQVGNAVNIAKTVMSVSIPYFFWVLVNSHHQVSCDKLVFGLDACEYL
jgi:hypothetical protein